MKNRKHSEQPYNVEYEKKWHNISTKIWKILLLMIVLLELEGKET